MDHRESDWIRINRSLMLNDLWLSEPFTAGQAWVDLLMVANWKNGMALVKGEVIPLHRGQLCRSMKQLAIRWQWSDGKVKRFLKKCEKLRQITFENWSKNVAANVAAKSPVTTLITILNYDDYQGSVAANVAPTLRRRCADVAEALTEEEGKEVKKEKKEPKTKGQPFVLPSWVPLEAWQRFDDMRTAKSKKAWTNGAKTLTIKTLEKLTADPREATAIMDQSTMKGWAGIFPVKDQNDFNHQVREPSQQAKGAMVLSEMRRRLRDVDSGRNIGGAGETDVLEIELFPGGGIPPEDG